MLERDEQETAKSASFLAEALQGIPFERIGDEAGVTDLRRAILNRMRFMRHRSSAEKARNLSSHPAYTSYVLPED
jgi:hypothetical protein